MIRKNIYTMREGTSGHVVIDRVDKRNAVSLEMWRAIPELIEELDADRQVKTIVIRGVDDSAFASGVDIQEFVEIAASQERARDLMQIVHAAEQAIGKSRKPSIAMIRGACVGGGIELALACDLRFATRQARFSVPPAKLGLVYSLSSTRRLVELVGVGYARDLLYSARTFDGEEAYRMGLIERCVADDEIVELTAEYTRVLSSRSQYSIRVAKSVIDAASSGDVGSSTEIERLRLGSFDNPDLAEGVDAYFAKRSPRFTWGDL